MIEVNLRDKNNLITLTVQGKAPIRGRTASSQFFHSPLELILSALGLCVGGKINEYCRMNNLNPLVFEDILVDLDDHFIIVIKRPKDFEEEHIRRIGSEIESCSVAKELKRQVKLKWELNMTPTKELLKIKEKKGCCGN